MRAVFVSMPLSGHFDPMVPLASELDAAGHEVVVATGPDMVERAAWLRLSTLQVGPSYAEAVVEIQRRFPGGRAHGRGGWREASVIFTDVWARPMVAELMAALADRPPDLIVHEPNAYAGPLVARLLGIPSVCHHYSAPLSAEVAQFRGRAVAPLWDLWRCSPRPLGGLFDYLVLCLCPPSLWNPGPGQLPTAGRIRPMWAGGDVGPAWLDELGEDPMLYVTLGTVSFGRVDLFHTVLDALRHEPVNVVVTVGPRIDPEEFSPTYPNVHVERYIPQAALLPRCDLVVCHAGSGTMLGALAHGLPLLCLPLGADHFFNAEMCLAAGVARVLEPEAVTPESIRGEVRLLLGNPDYRARAATIRGEIDQMPTPAEWVQPLERLAAQKQTLMR
jgi:UDP:flavonoid glycosyltransferase YjiC (YdhE family)